MKSIYSKGSKANFVWFGPPSLAADDLQAIIREVRAALAEYDFRAELRMDSLAEEGDE